MNNTFSLLLKKEIIDNRKPLLLFLVGIMVTYILLGAFIGYSFDYNCGIELFLFTFIASIIIAIVASLAFSNMKTKEDRINTLMMPATVSQKFFIRWIATVPLLLIIILIGYVLGDCARMMMMSINDVYVSKMWVFISEYKKEDFEMFSCIIISGILCTQALYFLGSILWPKLSFIKTMAALQIIQLIFGIILICIPRNFSFNLDMTTDGFRIFAYIFDFIFCTIIYWLAYVRFKNSQVIYKLF